MKRKILVVDDERDFLEVITMRLKAHDFEVVTASSAKECIAQAKELAPDVIIMDIMMPELDGIAAILKLKADNETKSIPVIICTAVKENEDEIVAQNLGVADYFRKTSQLEDLVAKIERILKK